MVDGNLPSIVDIDEPTSLVACSLSSSFYEERLAKLYKDPVVNSEDLGPLNMDVLQDVGDFTTTGGVHDDMPLHQSKNSDSIDMQSLDNGRASSKQHLPTKDLQSTPHIRHRKLQTFL